MAQVMVPTEPSTKPFSLSKEEFARRVDHTALKPTATVEDIDRLCDEAKKYGFWSVCVGPYYANHSSVRLAGSQVRTCVVTGFPLGFAEAEVKLSEAILAMQRGADEIDMVMNISAFKSKNYTAVSREIQLAAEACHAKGRILKVIVECCYLTDDEKVLAARGAEGAGADFVKTSTGFGPTGATVEDVRLLRRALSPRTRVKAAGGIGTLSTAIAMIQAGADRIGTSSGSKIMEEWGKNLPR
jgi:deoxyribose-phosphate aldolase